MGIRFSIKYSLKNWLILILAINILDINILLGKKLPDRQEIPRKITIGPYDNYQGEVRENHLYFTRLVNLTTRIYRNDLISEESRPLLDFTGDAKDPSPSPDGKKIAFTYFKHNANGDICIFFIEKNSVKCFKSSDNRDEYSFWIDDQKIGFIRTNILDSYSTLMERSLDSNRLKSLVEGTITSPSFSKATNSIAYNDIDPKSNRRVFHLLNIASNTKKIIDLDLPGFPGFSKFSENGRFLYFSYYLNDTNNDQIIDGSDHSVIFRVDLKKVKNSLRTIPEQLTSVETNCNFPFPKKDRLYITCAFEGSLDIYSIPKTGVIPTSWDKKNLWNAHRAARTNEERLLLLNVLLYKYPTEKKLSNIYERIVSNHLEIDELAAALFYVEKLIIGASTANKKNYYKILRGYFQLREAKKEEKSDQLSVKFLAKSRNVKFQLSQIKGHREFKRVIYSWIYYFQNNTNQAKNSLEKFKFTGKDLSPVTKYLAIQLAEKLFSGKKNNYLANAYVSLLSDSKLGLEANIYYGYQFLVFVENTIKDIGKRIVYLSQIKTYLPKNSKVINLIEAEKLALEIANLKVLKDENEAYQKLKKLVFEVKGDFYLRKAIFIRAINILSEYDKVDLSSKVSSDWLRYTDLMDLELENAGNQYTYLVFDKAYQKLSEKSYVRASSLFYSIIRHSNDLEGHFGYLSTNVRRKGQQKEIEETYEFLKKDPKYESSYPFYLSVHKLLAVELEGNKYLSVLEEVVEALEPLPLERNNPAIKFLLLGYCYSEMMLGTKEGLNYDKKMYGLAHKNFILAVDLGRDNFRIMASALTNLGNLHFNVGNYSLSSEYYKKRMDLPFLSLRNQIVVRSHFARSLYYAHLFDLAAENIVKNIDAIKGTSLESKFLPIMLEKAGFYNLYAKNYSKSVQYYDLFEKNKDVSQENKAKAYLAKGYSLMKLESLAEASSILNRSVKLFSQIKKREGNQQNPLGLKPKKQINIALGLLAKSSNQPNKKIEYLKKRISISKEMEDSAKEYSSTKSRIQTEVIKDYLKVALIYNEMNKASERELYFSKMIQSASKWASSEGYLQATSYNSLTNFMSFYIGTKVKPPQNSLPFIKNILEGMDKRFIEEKKPTPLFTFRKIKLKLIAAGFNNKKNFHQVGQNLLGSQELKPLKKNNPELYVILQHTFSGIKKTLQ